MSVNGGRSTALRSVWWIAGALGLIAGGVVWAGGQGKAAALLAGLGVLLPVAAFLADKIAARSGDLDIATVADRLADLVRDQWDVEATRRGVRGSMLEVFWQGADADLVYSWADLQRQAAGGGNGPASATPGSGPGDLAGSGALLAAYERSPCKRLVVLGEAGAGKTNLLVRLVLDLLDQRQSGDPVPLLLPLASWDPAGPSLYAWLESQILREYAHLAAVDSATGRKRAGSLLDAGLILPVLDGLDEIFADGRDQALVALNDGLRSNVGLIISSRPSEFRTAVHPHADWPSIHLAGAAGIQLTPLTAPVVRDYLLANAGGYGSVRWAPVLAALATPASPLAQALTTPLAGSLASAIYNPRPRESVLGLPNPADLTTLPTPADVEQHLFAGFIPAAYRTHPDQPTPRWNAKQAERWLAFLAHHLEHRRHTTSLAWWELYRTQSRIALFLGRLIILGVISGYLCSIAFGPLGGWIGGAIGGLTSGVSSPTPNRFYGNRPTLFFLELPLMIGMGFFFAFTDGLISFSTAAKFGPAIALLAPLVEQLGSISTADTNVAPIRLLRQDRVSVLVAAVGWGTPFAIMFGPAFGIAITVNSALNSSTAYLIFVRLVLAARRQMPLHVFAFLEDAHDRGVLRQAGAVWEFRHANLQRYLAGPP